VERVIVASVVPKLTDAWSEAARKATGRDPMVVGPGLKTGLPIKTDNPHEVGADRIVNGIAPLASITSIVVAVPKSTTSTGPGWDASGAYLGGSIAPGVETSAEALFTKAARLSKVDLEDPGTVIGRNTRQSVQAGLLLGQAAMVDGLVRRTWDELGCETPVIATGGLAERMSALCETITEVDADLTLKGLRMVWEMNR
jgi:type III pantothenate kinase